jgi:hypothetical protein
MNDVSQTVNPLLEIDTDFEAYLTAYTRSFKGHMVDGNLDYAYESDYAVRQKIMGLGGASKLFKAVNTQDVSAEAKHLFMKCDQVGPLKYPEIYDVVKKCSERLEMVVPIVFIREDLEKALIYSIASDMIDPCIVITKSLVQKCSTDELTLLVGCECGRIQNGHCQFNFAYTYLNISKDCFKPVTRSYTAPVSSQFHKALSGWIKFGEQTAARAGMICLDKPGRFIDLMCGLYKKGYVDFYGRKQESFSSDLGVLSDSIHTVDSRSLKVDDNLTEIERAILAANEFLYCTTLYDWRNDIDGKEQKIQPVQICDVRTSMIVGNGGQR